jgi:hypothetical protein
MILDPHATLLVVDHLARRGSNIKCNAACGRAIYNLLRVIYHYWGWTGVMKAVGVGAGALSTWKLWVLYKTPIKRWPGRVDYDPVEKRFTVVYGSRLGHQVFYTLDAPYRAKYRN